MGVIDHVVERFPDKAALVRRLYLRDERFRAICEDLELSISSLHQFESRPDAHLRPEVDDYRRLLRELEHELHDYLTALKGS